MRTKASKRPSPDEEANANAKAANPPLAIRTQTAKRIRSEGSQLSLNAGNLPKKARVKASDSASRRRPAHSAQNSSEEDWSDAIVDSSDPAQGSEQDAAAETADSFTHAPPWTVRHRIYLDNELISCTTSTTRAGYHKFADFLLREQIETRLYHAHNGLDAHFATRHAVLRFWRRDGSLSEKWMDKDYGGAREHEFAMESSNDWTILHLAMGEDGLQASEADGEEQREEQDGEAEQGGEARQGQQQAPEAEAANQTRPELDDAMDEDPDQGEEVEGDGSNDDDDDTSSEPEVQPTMDITSHYLSDYEDARSIAAAPLIEAGDGTSYRWVEERRRKLEHQLLEWFHCSEPTCFNKGGTCISIAQNQHLHIDVKDLTDWSQMIAHANRSIAATTLHLAAKLIDDQVRAQDERLANLGRERDDEDDLEEALRLHPVIASLRPSQDAKTELEPLE